MRRQGRLIGDIFILSLRTIQCNILIVHPNHTVAEIYSCAFAWQEIENIMSTLAVMLPQHNMYPRGDFQCYQEDEKHFSLRQNLRMGYLAGEFDCVDGQLSLMVANWNFFEPRELAEMFLKLFQGRNYRMQVIVRH